MLRHHTLCVLLLFVLFLLLLPCAAHGIHYFGIKISHLLSTIPSSHWSLIMPLYALNWSLRFRLFNKLFSWPKLPHLFVPNYRCVLYQPSGHWLIYFLDSSYTTSSCLKCSSHTAQISVIVYWAFRKHHICQTTLLTRPLTWRLPWLSHCGSLLGFYFSIIPSPQCDMNGQIIFSNMISHNYITQIWICFTLQYDLLVAKREAYGFSVQSK